MSNIRIIAGLGNPGTKYTGTRHNVGFTMVEFMCEGTAWRKASIESEAEIAETSIGNTRVLLVKPLRFMNLSGEPVGELLRYYKCPVEELIVVHDEIDLPLGTLRLKQGGGEGGHNGVKSIAAHVGAEFVRLRLGVGRPPSEQAEREVSDWVLSKFTKEEFPIVRSMIERGESAIETVIKDGLKTAQNLFN